MGSSDRDLAGRRGGGDQNEHCPCLAGGRASVNVISELAPLLRQPGEPKAAPAQTLRGALRKPPNNFLPQFPHHMPLLFLLTAKLPQPSPQGPRAGASAGRSPGPAAPPTCSFFSLQLCPPSQRPELKCPEAPGQVRGAVRNQEGIIDQRLPRIIHQRASIYQIRGCPPAHTQPTAAVSPSFLSTRISV